MYESVRWGGWGVRGRMQKPHGRRGASTQAMQTQLLVLFCKGCQSNIRTTLHTKSYRRCPVNESLHGAPLRGVAGRQHGVLQEGSRGYHGGAYIDTVFEMGCFLFRFQMLVEMLLSGFLFFDFCLKKARLLLHVVLLPESQAVELLQGHAENLLEVLGR